MDENLSRGYILLNKNHQLVKPLSSLSSSVTHTLPPTDRFNLIYISLLLAGVGFLLPYNSFVIAVDYFQSRYPATTIVFDMSFIYILMAFVAVIINNILVESISLNCRINFGYGLSFATLIFVALFEIGAQSGGYQLNLMAVAVVALGCTIQQSSFYGYTSMLPSRYTQAVMTGESAAGVIVSANRIATKVLLPGDERLNTMLFFAISIVIVSICGVIHGFILPRTEFVQFYVNICSNDANNCIAPCIHNEDVGLVEMLEGNENKYGGTASANFGVLSIDTEDYCKLDTEVSGRLSKSSGRLSSRVSSGRDSASPIVTNRQVSIISRSDSTDFVLPFGIDDEELSLEESIKNLDENLRNSDVNNYDDNLYVKIKPKTSFIKHFRDWNFCENGLNRIKCGLISRMKVSKLILPYMSSITIAYFVTLALFPGIESEIISCKLGSWMPVILMAIFNATDFCGKIMASMFYQIGTIKLTLFTCLRVFLIPLLSLCASPRHNPFFNNEFWSYLFSAILGITNGIFGSLPMILAPLYVADDMKELTGNIMTLSYSIGLTSGSILSYGIDYLLGPPIDVNILCFNRTASME